MKRDRAILINFAKIVQGFRFIDNWIVASPTARGEEKENKREGERETVKLDVNRRDCNDTHILNTQLGFT